MKLRLPFPPSLNSLFPGKQRRHKSRAYELWIINARRMLNEQITGHIEVPVQVHYKFGRPKDKRRRDVFNYEKAISDILVSYGILEDDYLIQRGTVEWANDVEGVEVVIEPFKTEEQRD